MHSERLLKQVHGGAEVGRRLYEVVHVADGRGFHQLQLIRHRRAADSKQSEKGRYYLYRSPPSSPILSISKNAEISRLFCVSLEHPSRGGA